MQAWYVRHIEKTLKNKKLIKGQTAKGERRVREKEIMIERY